MEQKSDLQPYKAPVIPTDTITTSTINTTSTAFIISHTTSIHREKQAAIYTRNSFGFLTIEENTFWPSTTIH